MACGGYKKDYGCIIAEPVDDNLVQEGTNRHQLTVAGLQIYRRIKFENLEGTSTRNVPLFAHSSNVNRLKLTPAYFFMRDLGLAYLLYQVNILELHSQGYGNVEKFGYNIAMTHNQFPGGVFALSKYSKANKTEEEVKNLQAAATAATRLTAKLPVDPKEDFINAFLADPVSFLCMDTEDSNMVYKNGFTVIKQDGRLELVEGNSANKYILYLIPGKDFILELSLEEIENLVVHVKEFSDLQHWGLVFLFNHISSLGHLVPEKRRFKFIFVLDNKEAEEGMIKEIKTINDDTSEQLMTNYIYKEKEQQVKIPNVLIEDFAMLEIEALTLDTLIRQRSQKGIERKKLSAVVRTRRCLCTPEVLKNSHSTSVPQFFRDKIKNKSLYEAKKMHMKALLELLRVQVRKQADTANMKWEVTDPLISKQIEELKELFRKQGREFAKATIEHIKLYDPTNTEEIESQQAKIDCKNLDPRCSDGMCAELWLFAEGARDVLIAQEQNLAELGKVKQHERIYEHVLLMERHLLIDLMNLRENQLSRKSYPQMRRDKFSDWVCVNPEDVHREALENMPGDKAIEQVFNKLFKK